MNIVATHGGALFLPDSLEPNKEIKHVNVRPKDYIEE